MKVRAVKQQPHEVAAASRELAEHSPYRKEGKGLAGGKSGPATCKTARVHSME